MEVSNCSPVPYSLSDIQLPESPVDHVESKDINCTEKNQIDHVSDDVTDESTLSKNKSNGDSVHKLNSSQEEMSESETKDSSYSSDSPEKTKVTKNKSHSDDSSDSESYTNKISYKKRPVKYEDNSSNLAADSDEDHPKETVHKDRYSSDSSEKNKAVKNKKYSDDSSDADSHSNKISYKKKSVKHEDNSSNLAADSDDDRPKQTLRKEQKYAKSQQKSDESDSEKSSDSEKYSRHVESKHKSRSKHRKRGSRSSSSSSSRSSNSSPEKRHSKKSNVTKNKGFVEDECHQTSVKESDKKSLKYKKSDIAVESLEDNISIKKRFRIKRDNVSAEKSSPTKESMATNTTNKNIEKNSSSHSVSDIQPKQESCEEKVEKTDADSKSRKVMLTNRKLNRKSCEGNIEPKSKRGRWENFTSYQKSHALGISANALRNWFPDFKLTRETSVEVEQDEHSFLAADEKFGDISQGDTLNENESSMKQECTSQMDVEDSVSQEPNFDETVELGHVSKIIFIQNLVRPFTLNQLKDLLKQSGKIVEEYFWIDKIKSKCFVMYETEKEAIRARNALNNTRWPTSNPKILSVEFSSVEELEKHQSGNETQILKPPEPPAVESSDILETRVSHTVEEHKRKDKERRKEKERTKVQAPVREWDKDKIVQDSPEREHPPKEEKPRSSEKKEKKESKKRPTEDTPAKLLDDLFQKTKSVPCIYWLPLTEEQAKAREEQKKTRRLEREKRDQELKEQEAARRNRRARSSSRRREKENRKSSTRSRSPVSRRR